MTRLDEQSGIEIFSQRIHSHLGRLVGIEAGSSTRHSEVRWLASHPSRTWWDYRGLEIVMKILSEQSQQQLHEGSYRAFS